MSRRISANTVELYRMDERSRLAFEMAKLMQTGTFSSSHLWSLENLVKNGKLPLRGLDDRTSPDAMKQFAAEIADFNKTYHFERPKGPDFSFNQDRVQDLVSQGAKQNRVLQSVFETCIQPKREQSKIDVQNNIPPKPTKSREEILAERARVQEGRRARKQEEIKEAKAKRREIQAARTGRGRPHVSTLLGMFATEPSQNDGNTRAGVALSNKANVKEGQRSRTE